MGKKELIKKRTEIRDKYKVPGQNDYQKRAVNAVYFRSGSIRHEMAKALGGLQVNRWGYAFIDNKIGLALQMLETAVNDFVKENKISKDNKYFITEAQERTKAFGHPPGQADNPTRDLITLDTGSVYEYETDKKRASRHNDTTAVIVIMV